MTNLLEIKLLQKIKQLELSFSDGKHFKMPCEYLRANSPSAEVKQTNKQDVNIISIEPVGNYAVKLIFDDGHQTGIYSWEYLYELGSRYSK